MKSHLFIYLFFVTGVVTSIQAQVTQEPITKQELMAYIKALQEAKAAAKRKEAAAQAKITQELFRTSKVAQTQTEALLSIRDVEKKVKKNYNEPDDKALRAQVIANERKFYYGYYPLYHGQSNAYRPIQDLYKKLYEFFYLTKISDYVFLRARGPLFDRYRDVSDFLKQEIRKRGIIDDNLPDVRTFVLSVNLSLYGSIGLPGEETYHYFKKGISWARPKREMVVDVLNQFNCNPAYADQILELSDLLKTPEGTLLQIFMPKNIIDKYVYISWRQGLPYNLQLLEQLFGAVGAYQFIPHDVIKKVFGTVQEQQAANIQANPELTALLEKIADLIDQGKIKVSTILEQYANNPQQLIGIRYLQGRIVFTNQLLDPDSGLIIYRYDTIPAKQKRLYEQRLNDIVNKIIDEWVSRTLTTGTPANKTLVEQLITSLRAQGRTFTLQPYTPLVVRQLSALSTGLRTLYNALSVPEAKRPPRKKQRIQ